VPGEEEMSMNWSTRFSLKTRKHFCAVYVESPPWRPSKAACLGTLL